MKLSKAQQEAWDKIQNHIILTPDNAYRHHTWSPETDWTSEKTDYTWYANRIYGTFNTATLKALEKNGLIKVHEFGGHYNTDTIEII